jgi:hypothetical protein
MGDDSLDIAELLGKFRNVGTNDHDTLIQTFIQVVPGTDVEVVKFFLEANNWSLENAISSFMENNNQLGRQIKLLQRPKPNMNFKSIEDPAANTNPDGSVTYTVNEEFVKQFKIHNPGPHDWPPNVTLNFAGGDQLNGPEWLLAPAIPSGATVDVSLNFRAPSAPGNYGCYWMFCANGEYSTMFGEPLWIIITVKQAEEDLRMEEELSNVMQQWGNIG